MDTLEFLRSVWPADGHYCLLALENGKKGGPHIVRDSIEAIVDVANALAAGRYRPEWGPLNVYFVMHTLREPRVWDPNKENKRTGERGVWTYRTHANMKATRCFFMDLDVGESTELVKKFSDRADALRRLADFLIKTHLPWPTLTSSGRGVHAFWPLTQTIPVEEWRSLAARLKALTKHYDLPVDPHRVADESSVLRVPGTFHLKDPANPQLVEIKAVGVPTPTDEFGRLLMAACAEAGIADPAERVTPKHDLRSDALGTNIQSQAPTMKALGLGCAQVRRMIEHPADVSEPQWYQGLLNSVRFVEDGENWCHLVSRSYPGYSKEETDTKLQQLQESGCGPVTCGTLQSLCGREACAGCPFIDKLQSSPVVRARQLDDSPLPVTVVDLPGGAKTEFQSPPVPKGYRLRRGGGVMLTMTGDDNKDFEICIYPHELVPYDILYDAFTEITLVKWRAVILPHRPDVRFDMPLSSLYDSRAFASEVANAGLLPDPDQVSNLRSYMIAYANAMQAMKKDSSQYSHLGWTEDYTEFVLPTITITSKGTHSSAISENVENIGEVLRTRGTFERQIELLRFFEDPAYVGRQFLICCSLAAPLFHLTGHFGAVVHLTGVSGASKSTALESAASMWGIPHHYVINGTASGATQLSRVNKAAVLANLPVCVDEITSLKDEDARTLAFGSSQSGGRDTMRRDSVARRVVNRDKSTLILTTGNSSLHDKLATRRGEDAASMRIIEILCHKMHIHGVMDAERYLIDLRENCGHIGPAYIQAIMARPGEIAARMEKMKREVAARIDMDASERFWNATAASALVACQLAHEFGLLHFDPAYMQQWLYETQFPAMRSVIHGAYLRPDQSLAQLIDSLSGELLVVTNSNQRIVTILKAPGSRQLSGRLEKDSNKLFLSYAQFREWCERTGFTTSMMLSYLRDNQVATYGRMTLGKGTTEYSHAQVPVLIIDMTHPLLSGHPALSVVDDTSPVVVAPTPPAGNQENAP